MYAYKIFAVSLQKGVTTIIVNHLYIAELQWYTIHGRL